MNMIKGFGIVANEVVKQQVEANRRQQQQRQAENIENIFETFFGTTKQQEAPKQQEKAKEDLFDFEYDIEYLAGLTTYALKQECYSVYQEYMNSKDEEKREIAYEARELWIYKIPSEDRHRARMIKFLCTKANI